MTFYPKVSIIIPVYNGANFLHEAIDAALAQTYKNIEILVINDGSSDNGATEKIALGYQSRINYFKKENGGVSTALNYGIQRMSGDYFSWLSHDDLYMPSKVEEQINFLSTLNNKKNIVLYSDYAQKIDKINKTKEIHLKNTAPEAFRYRLTIGNDINGCTMLIPKSAFDDFGFFDENLRAVQDYEMWLRLSKEYQFIHVPKVLVIGRVHDQQVGVRLKDLALRENIDFRNKSLANLTAADIAAATGKVEGVAFADISEYFLKKRYYSIAMTAAKFAIVKSDLSSLRKYNIFLLYFAQRITRGGLIGFFNFLREKLASLYYNIKS